MTMEAAPPSMYKQNVAFDANRNNWKWWCFFIIYWKKWQVGERPRHFFFTRNTKFNEQKLNGGLKCFSLCTCVPPGQGHWQGTKCSSRVSFFKSNASCFFCLIFTINSKWPPQPKKINPAFYTMQKRKKIVSPWRIHLQGKVQLKKHISVSPVFL